MGIILSTETARTRYREKIEREKDRSKDMTEGIGKTEGKEESNRRLQLEEGRKERSTCGKIDVFIQTYTVVSIHRPTFFM